MAVTFDPEEQSRISEFFRKEKERLLLGLNAEAVKAKARIEELERALRNIRESARFVGSSGVEEIADDALRGGQ